MTYPLPDALSEPSKLCSPGAVRQTPNPSDRPCASGLAAPDIADLGEIAADAIVKIVLGRSRLNPNLTSFVCGMERLRVWGDLISPMLRNSLMPSLSPSLCSLFANGIPIVFANSFSLVVYQYP